VQVRSFLLIEEPNWTTALENLQMLSWVMTKRRRSVRLLGHQFIVAFVLIGLAIASVDMALISDPVQVSYRQYTAATLPSWPRRLGFVIVACDIIARAPEQHRVRPQNLYAVLDRLRAQRASTSHP
jgi:hypothetical protein